MLDVTPLFRLYAHRRMAALATQDPVAVQERELRRLVGKSKSTAFGREHEFGRIASVADYQARVPLGGYQDFQQAYWQAAYPRVIDRTWPGKIPYFAATSGTSAGLTKLIPVSWEMVASNRRAALDVLAHHVMARPRSHILGGRTLFLGGSTDLVREPGGAFRGDLSGIAAREVPLWVRSYVLPPRDVALMTDWDRKTDIMARASLHAGIRAVGGTANWLLLFLAKVIAQDPARRSVAACYPDLELLIHGGMDFRPYRAEFSRILAGSDASLREVYAASEGFVAIADRGYGEGMRLILDNGLFFEFVPVEEMAAAHPVRHWVGNIEAGLDYVVVLSTCAGLWSYVLGDIVRFIETRPPRLLITGRTSYFLSAFGEHLSGEQIEHAVVAAADALAVPIGEFTVGPLFPNAAQPSGRHLYLVEFPGKAPQLEPFAEAIDSSLQRANLDYRDLRAGDFGLLAPMVEAVAPGTFIEWMRSRGRLGGQNKVPRVLRDPSQMAALRAFAEAHG